nr:cytochrome C [Desulfobulbaceae bacterium]
MVSVRELLAAGISVIVFFTVTACVVTKAAHHGFLLDAADSQACVECHYGTGDLGVGPGLKKCSADLERSHPVNMAYPPAGKDKLFNSAAFIREKGLELTDGKMICLSCHNLRRGLAKHLAVTNSGSQLCLTCHRM